MAESGTTAPELDRPFHVMTKPAGAACNLECEYCYYLDKADLYPEKSDFRMSEETLSEFIGQYIEAHPGPEVTFAWQGGEPTLMGVDFFRDVVRLQEPSIYDSVAGTTVWATSIATNSGPAETRYSNSTRRRRVTLPSTRSCTGSSRNTSPGTSITG